MSSEHWTGVAPRALRPSLLGRLLALLARRLRRFPVRLQLWSGEVLTPHPGAVHATIVVRNAKTLVQILLDPVFRLAEAYSCLLYTSPSPRDLSTSRMPSSA